MLMNKISMHIRTLYVNYLGQMRNWVDWWVQMLCNLPNVWSANYIWKSKCAINFKINLKIRTIMLFMNKVMLHTWTTCGFDAVQIQLFGQDVVQWTSCLNCVRHWKIQFANNLIIIKVIWIMVLSINII